MQLLFVHFHNYRVPSTYIQDKDIRPTTCTFARFIDSGNFFWTGIDTVTYTVTMCSVAFVQQCFAGGRPWHLCVDKKWSSHIKMNTHIHDFDLIRRAIRMFFLVSRQGILKPHLQHIWDPHQLKWSVKLSHRCNIFGCFSAIVYSLGKNLTR